MFAWVVCHRTTDIYDSIRLDFGSKLVLSLYAVVSLVKTFKSLKSIEFGQHCLYIQFNFISVGCTESHYFYDLQRSFCWHNTKLR